MTKIHSHKSIWVHVSSEQMRHSVDPGERGRSEGGAIPGPRRSPAEKKHATTNTTQPHRTKRGRKTTQNTSKEKRKKRKNTKKQQQKKERTKKKEKQKEKGKKGSDENPGHKGYMILIMIPPSCTWGTRDQRIIR
jgi:hypothetical protein